MIFVRSVMVSAVYTKKQLVPAGMGDVAIYTEMDVSMMGPYGCSGYNR